MVVILLQWVTVSTFLHSWWSQGESLTANFKKQTFKLASGNSCKVNRPQQDVYGSFSLCLSWVKGLRCYFLHNKSQSPFLLSGQKWKAGWLAPSIRAVSLLPLSRAHLQAAVCPQAVDLVYLSRVSRGLRAKLTVTRNIMQVWQWWKWWKNPKDYF